MERRRVGRTAVRAQRLAHDALVVAVRDVDVHGFPGGNLADDPGEDFSGRGDTDREMRSLRAAATTATSRSAAPIRRERCSQARRASRAGRGAGGHGLNVGRVRRRGRRSVASGRRTRPSRRSRRNGQCVRAASTSARSQSTTRTSSFVVRRSRQHAADQARRRTTVPRTRCRPVDRTSVRPARSSCPTRFGAQTKQPLLTA